MSDHPTPQAEAHIDYKTLIIKATVFFVVIAVGITTGIVIATKLGVADKFVSMTLSPENLENSSCLQIGQPFPLLETVDGDGEFVDLLPLLQGRKCIIGIISAGCQPCHRLVRFLEVNGFGRSDDIQVILLALDPQPFKDETELTVVQVASEALEEFEIYAFPTIIGVADDGRISLVSSGFSRHLTEDFLRDNI